MRKIILIFSLVSMTMVMAGCDAFKTPADEIRPHSGPTTSPNPQPPATTTVPTTTTPTPPPATPSVTPAPVISTTAVDTSAWQRFEFKELGFSLLLPFANKDITLTYKEARQNEKQPVSASNPLMYWYKGFLKGQTGEYALIGGTSENYVSGKQWELTDANQLIKIGDNYQVGEVQIMPLAHVPVQGNLLIAFDATKNFYQPIKSPLASEQWYAAVFTLPNNKRFRVALLQFKAQDLSLDQLVAALKSVQFTTSQFPLAQAGAPASTPPQKKGVTPKRNPGNAPFVINRSNNPVVCGNSPTGGKNTNWIYSCSDRRDTYSAGETAYGLFRIDNIFKNFRFKIEVYKDGVFQWEELGNWNTVDPTWGWARNYATPVFGNLAAGNWEVQYFVDTGSGFSDSPLATSNFRVYGSVAAPSPQTPSTPQTPAAPYVYDNNGTICGSQPSGGSWSNWWYTCSNPQTTFYRGQTAYVMIHIDKVYIKHRFTMEVYKDGTYQWPDTSNFNDVDTQNGWSHAFYLPVLGNLQPGNWSANIYLQRPDGTRQFLKALTFQVLENQQASNCATTNSYLSTHGEGAQVGSRVCDSNNSVYTISNVINSDGCYTPPAGQTTNVTIAQDAIYLNGQQYLSYGTRTARVLVGGCYGYGAPAYTGDSTYRVYSATQPFRIIVGF